MNLGIKIYSKVLRHQIGNSFFPFHNLISRDSITGTSTRTATVIAKVTPEWTPNKI